MSQDSHNIIYSLIQYDAELLFHNDRPIDELCKFVAFNSKKDVIDFIVSNNECRSFFINNCVQLDYCDLDSEYDEEILWDDNSPKHVAIKQKKGSLITQSLQSLSNYITDTQNFVSSCGYAIVNNNETLFTIISKNSSFFHSSNKIFTFIKM